MRNHRLFGFKYEHNETTHITVAALDHTNNNINNNEH